MISLGASVTLSFVAFLAGVLLAGGIFIWRIMKLEEEYLERETRITQEHARAILAIKREIGKEN